MTKEKAINYAIAKSKATGNEFFVYRDLEFEDWYYFVCAPANLPEYVRESDVIFSTWE